MKVVGLRQRRMAECGKKGVGLVLVLKLSEAASRAHGKEDRFQGCGSGVGIRSIISLQAVVRARQAAGLTVPE